MLLGSYGLLYLCYEASSWLTDKGAYLVTSSRVSYAALSGSTNPINTLLGSAMYLFGLVELFVVAFCGLWLIPNFVWEYIKDIQKMSKGFEHPPVT